jgi:hypothetical protein
MRCTYPLLTLILLASCGGTGDTTGGTGPLMAQGKDCLGCHGFTAAGTVFTSSGAGAEGVAVLVGGVTLTSNAAGNFYTSAPISFPAVVEARSNGTVKRMPSPAPSGACNGCHGGSASRIQLP